MRDKQIEEMSCIIYAGKTIGTPCVAIANVLYDQGYRKASDVAREIFEEIKKIIVHRILHNENYSFEGVMDSITNDLDELKKKYESEGDK